MIFSATHYFAIYIPLIGTHSRYMARFWNMYPDQVAMTIEVSSITRAITRVRTALSVN